MDVLVLSLTHFGYQDGIEDGLIEHLPVSDRELCTLKSIHGVL